MKRFFLSQNTKFEFNLFAGQHIISILIFIFLLMLIIVFKNKILKIKKNNFKIIKVMMAFIILINMLVYRISYIIYGAYDIRIHLSLYFCHIVNYLFCISVLFDNKKLYKIVYCLCWSSTIWVVFFPDVSGGIDCFIFYSSFISHNLLLIFIFFIICHYNLRINIKDILNSIIICIFIFLFTGIVNYDFNTKYNSPNSILGLIDNRFLFINEFGKYLILLIIGIVGILIGYLMNKIIARSYLYEKNK